jgi:acetyltransferase-like isoleucine patch superfamily enzyme
MRFLSGPIAYHKHSGVVIGRDLDLIMPQGSMHMFGSEPYLVQIGDGVTICSGVDFVTHDGGLRVVRDVYPGAYRYRRIVICDNAFIGMRAIILPGVTIGSGAIVGAGAVVSRDVPAGCVAAGVPARSRRSRSTFPARNRGRIPLT